MSDHPTKYLFFGFDHNTAFEKTLTQYRVDPDCVIIEPRKGETFEQAIKRAKIPASSDVFLMCHGGQDDTFTWNSNEPVHYSTFFRGLPEGTRTAILDSCFGGLATRYLQLAPRGTTVETMVSAGNVSFMDLDFYNETKNLNTSIAYYLEALDSFNVGTYTYNVRQNNAKYGTRDDDHPGRALPTIVGIGGNPPRPIDMMKEFGKLTAALKGGALDAALWKNTLDEAKCYLEKEDENIDAVAQKMRKGEPLEDPDTLLGAQQKRLALAITASYLDASGLFTRMVEETKQQSRPRPAGKLIDQQSPCTQAANELFPLSKDILNVTGPELEMHDHPLEIAKAVYPQFIKGDRNMREAILARLSAEHVQESPGKLEPWAGAIAILKRTEQMEAAARAGNVVIPPLSTPKKLVAEAVAYADRVGAAGDAPSVAGPGKIDLLAVRGPLELAYCDLFGEAPGSSCVLADHGKIGLERLKTDVAHIVLAARDRGFESIPEFRDSIFAGMYQQWMEAPPAEKNTWVSAMAVLRHAESIHHLQNKGETELEGFSKSLRQIEAYKIGALATAGSYYMQRKQHKESVGPLYEPEVAQWPGTRTLEDDELLNYALNLDFRVDKLRPDATRSGESTLTRTHYQDITRMLQQGLAQLQDDALPVTGEYDEKTLSKVRMLQKKYGLREDGVIDHGTVLALQVAELAKLVGEKKLDTEAIGLEEMDIVQMYNADNLPPKVKREILSLAGALQKRSGGDDKIEGLAKDLREFVKSSQHR